MKNWIKTVVFCIIAFAAFGAPTAVDRSFDSDKMEAYRNDSDFDYSKDYRESGSLITLLLVYLLNVLDRLLTNSGVGWLVPWVWRGLLLTVVSLVIYYILKNRYGSFWVKESKHYAPMSIATSVGTHVDYAKFLQESMQRGEYRLSVRYLFLKSLNDLGANGALTITQWKAPYDYLYELSGEQKLAFGELIDLFEMTWYGAYEADQRTIDRGLEISQKLFS